MYTASLLLAIRSRFFGLFLFFVGGLVLAVLCAAEFSGRQPATVALDVGLSFIRFALPLMAVLLIQELLFREIERRYYLCSLTYPSPRYRFFLARVAAISSLLLAFLLFMAVVLALVVKWVSLDYEQATPVDLTWKYGLVIAFIAIDSLVVVACAALLAVFASSPGFVLLGGLGFVLIARSYAAVIELLAQNSGLVVESERYQAGLGVLGYLLPNLGAQDVRAIALYGKWEFLPADWYVWALSSLLYAVCLMALAVWGLQRKHFA